MSSILAMEDRIDAIMSQLLECLDDEAAAETPFDLSRWINFFTVDMVSELAYGAAFGCLRTRPDVSVIVAGLQGGACINVVLSLFPFIKMLFSGPLGKLIKPPETSGIVLAMKVGQSPSAVEHQTTGHGILLDGRKIVNQRRENPNGRRDLLNAILTSKDPQGFPIHAGRLRGETITTLAAGSDTTGMTILGCIGNLLQSPSILVHLQEELDKAATDGRLDPQTPTYTQLLSNFSYLETIIN
jgi:hypothetical protein